ncbi:hypothetical protein [Bordetella ansorpii]|nr:hypothetical protein [Bordetella ansorpii]
MTLKKKIEDNAVVLFCGAIIAGFAAGWAASEIIRVQIKAEMISELSSKEKSASERLYSANSEIESLKRKVSLAEADRERFKSDFDKSNSDLNEYKRVLEQWRKSNGDLQETVKSYASNCNVLLMAKDIEKKKERTESLLESAYSWDSEKPKISDYKRQVAEYQARLLALNDKLVCQGDM